MKEIPAFEFVRLKEPVTGSGYSKYWSYCIRMHGRSLIKDIIQTDAEDLLYDPWDKGWSEEK